MWGQTDAGPPRARRAQLVMERVEDELVVYDSDSNQAHCLNAVAAAVFLVADGATTPYDIATAVSIDLKREVDVAQVEQALEELDECGLLDTADARGISRRTFMRGSAALGGVAVAGAWITSVAAPAYGDTISQIFPTGFSALAVLIAATDCKGNTYYYGMQWSGASAVNSDTPPSSGQCGWPGSHPGQCNKQWSPVPLTGPNNTPVNELSGCLGGVTVAVVASGSDGGVQVTLPAPSGNSPAGSAYSSYAVVDYAYGCGSGSYLSSGCNNYASDKTDFPAPFETATGSNVWVIPGKTNGGAVIC